MIKLKIKKPGYTIAIPGLSPFRTPVDIDISDVDIRTIAMYLKSNGIDDYEIEATTDTGHVEVYTKKEFEGIDNIRKKDKQSKGIEDRFFRLEKRVEKLIRLMTHKMSSKDTSDKEQIIDTRLEKIEDLLHHAFTRVPSIVRAKETDEPEIEELDSYIPDIDISDMKLKSKEHRTIKQENKNAKDAADALSNLTRGKK